MDYSRIWLNLEQRGPFPGPVSMNLWPLSPIPTFYDPPPPLVDAIEQVECWLEAPALILLGESPGYWQTLRNILEGGRVVGPQVHDARIAALCTQHGITELWTADRDFNRFQRLPVINPLVLSG